ncbi:MAG: threonine synthase [Pseudomonadota bacterium]
MRYISTRGQSPGIGFRDAALAGLAPDGGLYMPETWPMIAAADRAAFAGAVFPEVAAGILSAFAGAEISRSDLLAMAKRAYGAFDTPEVAPVVDLGGDDYLLELFHGPTLAFKDVAMRMLAQLYDWALEGSARGKTIIGATSGDTGGAAIHAFAGSTKAEVFMLHPQGRISDVQRRMMTTVKAKNIVNIAVEGTFDDCQSIVKTLFADPLLTSAHDLGGVNSINFVRLAVQTVYYFTACARVEGPVSFVVPTGNFGDVFAGYAAKKMGAKVARLGVAVNSNDIMRRAIVSGVYEPSSAQATSSPSMDIQIASNFERLLYEAVGRDADALRALMGGFEKEGRMVLSEGGRRFIEADFCAASASEDEVAAKIRGVLASTGMLIDPHTAVGLAGLEKLRASGEITGPAISLATAHPAKFPGAVKAASGKHPELPMRYADLFAREEQMISAPAKASAIRTIILNHSLFG